MLERYLIEYCSPTLASIKTANLFRYVYSREKEFKEYIDSWNQELSQKGVYLEVLKKGAQDALIYVYRKQKLREDLQREGVFEFLKKCGYPGESLEGMIDFLKKRLSASENFPHEIGLFLGYPLEDVVGFVENGGKNSKCSGYWKVYGDQDYAMKLFQKFKKCKIIYKYLFSEGRTISQLTVAA